MKKHILFVFSLIVIAHFSISGQNNIPSKSSPLKAAKGTYQFIVNNSKAQVAFSEEILIEVEKNRDEKEVKYLQLGSQAKVKILSRSEINSQGFVPIKDEIIYLE